MITWDLSTREWHAVDKWAEHPEGVFRTVCGQLLSSRTTTLHESFSGAVCEQCARRQMAAALRTVPSTNAGRPLVAHCPPAAPGGRPTPRSTLRSRVTALIMAVLPVGPSRRCPSPLEDLARRLAARSVS